MKLLVVNGVNLNMLGIREKALYGEKTYKDLVRFVKAEGKKRKVKIKCVQSNEEGKIVRFIQKAYSRYDGIIINAGAYTHTSIAILDALKAVSLPTVEVHLTDVKSRESYRRFSYIEEYAFASVCGKGFDGYKEAIGLFLAKSGNKFAKP